MLDLARAVLSGVVALCEAALAYLCPCDDCDGFALPALTEEVVQ